MINPHAHNWVDRGEPAELVLRRVLGFHLGLALDDDRLSDHANAVLGMAEADATETQIASYVGHLEDELGLPRSDASLRRLLGIALWHITKAAEVRDRAIRVLEEYGPETPHLAESFTAWLAERMGTQGDCD